MSSPNKYYLVESILDTRNCDKYIDPIKLILQFGGIDNMILWCTKACLAFEHDLDKSTMTIFGGEPTDEYFFLKMKVKETPKAAGGTMAIGGAGEPFRQTKQFMSETFTEDREELANGMVTIRQSWEFKIPVEEPTFNDRLVAVRWNAIEYIKAFMKDINQFFCHSTHLSDVIIFRQVTYFDMTQILKKKNGSIIIMDMHAGSIAIESLTTEALCKIADYLKTVKNDKQGVN